MHNEMRFWRDFEILVRGTGINGYNPKVVLSNSSFTKLLASILPLYCAWTFMACIWLCSDHGREEYADCVNQQTKTVELFGHCDHCPIKEARGVIPNKQSTTNLLTDTLAGTIIIPSQRAGYALHSPARIHLPLSTADPPLERLCVYRI